MNNTDLDMSWVDEYSRLHVIENIMQREPIDSIVIQTIYMNTQSEIEKVDKDEIKIEIGKGKIPIEKIEINTQFSNYSVVSKEQLQQFIQTKQNNHSKKYTVFDIILYKVDLHPHDIQAYANESYKNIGKIKTCTLEEDIIIPESLYIFHSLHAIYIFLREHCKMEHPKSIIKLNMSNSNDNSNGNKTKHTKKVRILEDTEYINIVKPHKKTRKHVM